MREMPPARFFVLLFLLLSVLFSCIFMALLFSADNESSEPDNVSEEPYEPDGVGDKQDESDGVIVKETIWNILVSVVAGLVTSVLCSLFSWFFFARKWLKNIPENTEKLISNLLNERLNYETGNHNAVLAALNPDNKALSVALNSESYAVLAALNPNNKILSEEHDKLSSDLKFLREEVMRAAGRREAAADGSGIKIGAAFSAIEGVAEVNITLRAELNKRDTEIRRLLDILAERDAEIARLAPLAEETRKPTRGERSDRDRDAR
jgi:hypothetical protein